MKIAIGSTLAAALALAGIAGCGGPDLFSTAGRGNTLDAGLGGSFGNFDSAGTRGTADSGRPARIRGVYPMVEASFELPDLAGNPFDFTENDVAVAFQTPDGRTLKLPAFFDGDKTWRVRITPDTSGRLQITGVTVNGKPVSPDKMEKREFDVSGTPRPGFVVRDARDRTRFAFTNGSPFFPIGHNQAFAAQAAAIPPRLEKMGSAGENWSRIWMTHWDGKNLDWTQRRKLELGSLDLEVARRWDEIVAAAEKSRIHFQLVLQHHGQYSTTVNPNWAENPWNKKNGGFLATPDEFFTDPRAIRLTQAKYRYIIARWGFSPAIMAWELFNEVENTDSALHKHGDEIVAWHNTMAAFLRKHDPWKRPVTTSSDILAEGLWAQMDFFQPHAYPHDPASMAAVERHTPFGVPVVPEV